MSTLPTTNNNTVAATREDSSNNTENHGSGTNIYSINKDDLILMLLGVFLPPAPVIVRKGFCSKDTLLSVLLTIIFYFPALVHSAYVVYTTSKQRPCNRDSESADENVTENGNKKNKSKQNKNKDEDRVPLVSNNGDFDVDLENGENLPTYSEVSTSSSSNTNANGFPVDNKIQQ